MRCIIIEKNIELYEFDEEETNKAMGMNDMDDDKIMEFCDLKEEFFAYADLGIVPTIINIRGAYIVSKDSAEYYEDTYGWKFSRYVLEM